MRWPSQPDFIQNPRAIRLRSEASTFGQNDPDCNLAALGGLTAMSAGPGSRLRHLLERGATFVLTRCAFTAPSRRNWSIR